MALSLNDVRRRCRQVVSQASHVRIDRQRVEYFAMKLARTPISRPVTSPADDFRGSPEQVVAYVLTLDAINFGSGYSPWLTNKIDNSLYYTVVSQLRLCFETSGPLTAIELRHLSVADVARLFPLEGPPSLIRELLQQFTGSLNELGALALDLHGGDLAAIVRAANGSAQQLIELLTKMPSFKDVAPYHELMVPFYRRAQLTVADLWMRLPGSPYGRFDDIDAPTAFADNAVPHVLHTDGLLVYDERLEQLIARRTLLPAGSDQEVEIRAAIVSAIDMIVEAITLTQPRVNDVMIDTLLWRRGHEPEYAQQPRHLTQTVFY